MRNMLYKANDQGICFGLAHMGMQAILSRDIARFDKRLEEIRKIPSETFNSTIEEVMQQKKENERENKGGKQITNEIISEVPAFFDGIEIYHQAYLYPYLFEQRKKPLTQNAMLASSLVLSKELEKKGGISKVDSFVGTYTLTRLEDYFSGLEKTADDMIPRLDEPITLVLNSVKHTITVAYDAIEKQWLFIDAHNLPTQYVKNASEIANLVLPALSKNGVSTFSTSVFATNFIAENETISNAEKAKQCMISYKNQEKFQKIHAIPSTKEEMLTDSYQTSLLHIAAQQGYLDTVKQLMNTKGIDLDKPNIDSHTPLYLAAKFGHIDIINTLLESNKIDPNKLNEKGVTALFAAVQAGQLDALKTLLRSKHIDPNIADAENVTALFFCRTKRRPRYG